MSRGRARFSDRKVIRFMRTSVSARLLLAVLLVLVLVFLIVASWVLLGGGVNGSRKKMPPLAVPSIIPSDSAQTCQGIPDQSVQALLGSYNDDLTYKSVHLQRYTTCTVMDPDGDILRIVYGRSSNGIIPSGKLAEEKNGATPFVLNSSAQGDGLVIATDSADAEAVYRCGQEKFISVTVRGYVIGTPVESNLINMVNSILPLACSE